MQQTSIVLAKGRGLCSLESRLAHLDFYSESLRLVSGAGRPVAVIPELVSMPD